MPEKPNEHDAVRAGGTLSLLLRRRRRAMGLTLAEAARRVACAKSYLSAIETGTRGPPGEELLVRMEHVLGFRSGELIEAARLDRTPGPIREDLEALRERDKRTRELVRTLKSLGERGESIDALHRSGRLDEMIRAVEGGEETDDGDAGADLAGAPSAIESVPLPVEIPVINKVTAGYPAAFTDLGYPARVADEYVRAPDVHDPDAFAARVVGDSMAPDYAEGDIVVFSPAREIVSGMDCFIRLEPDHESTFKRVYFERSDAGGELIRIQPINSAYAPMVVERERVAGLYAGVSVTRPIGGD